MIYCGSGSISRDRLILAQFVNDKKFVQNLAFSMIEAALFPRQLASNFWLLTFVLHFMLDPGPNSVREQECITVPIPLRQKKSSGSTTLGHKLRFYIETNRNIFFESACYFFF